MPRLRPWYLALALAPVLTPVLTPTASATTLVERSLDELSRDADVVVVGLVRASRSFWSGGRIYTDLDVEVMATARGALAPGSRLVVRNPGGTVEGVSQVLVGAAELEPGHGYVLLLGEPRDGTRRVLGLAAGALPLVATPTGALRVMPARTSDLHFLPGRGAPPALVLPPAGVALADFLSRLRGIAR